MANEHELMSLGGQAAAAAHSLGTPLSTIALIAKELKNEFGNNKKIASDIELLISQSNRCNDILKKLSINPRVEDDFILSEYSFYDHLTEIINSFKNISKKNFILHAEEYENPIKLDHSTEINYGLRNFISNASKYAKKEININLRSDQQITEIKIDDDGDGFPSDIINKLGEPYVKSNLQQDRKPGLGLGAFIGKTLLERNFAIIDFMNDPNKGASVIIKWKNSDLKKI
jgi:two-component system sensor histidine kinase RegB